MIFGRYITSILSVHLLQFSSAPPLSNVWLRYCPWPILCHFPTPFIERIYYFETLTFRESIDIFFKSTILIFLTKLNVPTKIVNVLTDQAELKSGRQRLPHPTPTSRPTGYATGRLNHSPGNSKYRYPVDQPSLLEIPSRLNHFPGNIQVDSTTSPGNSK